MSSGMGKVVCVTGASGYIASYLLEEGTFDAAIAGCDCVFHTASPFYHNVKDPKLLDPAVNGTLNVLRSCKKASIKRVIVTSSMAVVAYNGKPRTPDVVVDETWFSSAEVKVFVSRNGSFLEERFLSKELSGSVVELHEVIEPSLQPVCSRAQEVVHWFKYHPPLEVNVVKPTPVEEKVIAYNDHVVPSAYIEKPPFPVRIKDHSKDSTLIRRGYIRTPTPPEQIRIAFVPSYLVDPSSILSMLILIVRSKLSLLALKVCHMSSISLSLVDNLMKKNCLVGMKLLP
ncbi:hypothetical protein ZWY2020_031983 [Hordeum vulgare]|nr:hypothetical protein ZWY2020_031983 [Hordeum vulgare]